MKVAVAMLGARRHYAVPRLLQEAGWLEHFYTDIYVGNKPWLLKVLRILPSNFLGKGLKRLLGRLDRKLPAHKVTSFEHIGIYSAWARRHGPNSYARKRIVEQKVAEAFCKKVLLKGFGNADIVFGFDGASLEIFEAAKRRGIKCILDQTILPRGPKYQLLLEESRAWPGWDGSLQVSDLVSASFSRETREWELADAIFAGSDFVKKGLLESGVSKDKIIVVPYGQDLSRYPLKRTRRVGNAGDPLRVLFVGSVSLRKGVPYLLEALRNFSHSEVEARFVGRSYLPPELQAFYQHVATFIGAVPRSEVAKAYEWADLLCLPSIAEGSAAVVYEALLSGLPVITTPNAGTMVRDNVDGQIVPIRSSEKITYAIERYLRDRALLSSHAANAVLGRQRLGEARYMQDFLSAVRRVGVRD